MLAAAPPETTIGRCRNLTCRDLRRFAQQGDALGGASLGQQPVAKRPDLREICGGAGVDDESTLNLYYWNGDQWQGVLPCSGCSLDTDNNVLVAVLGHFSEFGFMGDGNPTAVIVSSFVACSGGAALTPNQATFLRWLVLTGLTLIAFGLNGPARVRPR